MESSVPKRSHWSQHIILMAVILLFVTVIAWILMVAQSRSMMNIPGTMGMSLWTFCVMWGLMMAAMMLPSISPLFLKYVRLIDKQSWLGFTSFFTGYFFIWSATGVVAFFVAWFFGKLAYDLPIATTITAIIAYVICGLYQISRFKEQCLTKCRAPFSLLLTYASWRGKTRHFRVGVHHGLYCLGCCWVLMVLMIVSGVMNIGVMIILTTVISIEKLWAPTRLFSSLVGISCFVLAFLVIWFPGLAPGLIITNPMEM